MKIIIPNYRPGDSFVDNVAFTLEQMGHEVATMPSRPNRYLASPLIRVAAELTRRARPMALTPQETWLLRTLNDFKADLLLCLTQPLKESVLHDCKRLGVTHAVAWWGDAPANMKGVGLLVDGWDWIYLKDRLAVDKLTRLGLNAVLLHEAFNPSWHFPQGAERNSEVVIAGTFYGYRQALTTRLIERGVEVGLYGAQLPRWADVRIRERHTGRFVIKEDKSRVFESGLACLNSTSMAEGDSLNCRAFEICGAGGLQLLESRSITPECFEPGHDLLHFETVDEAVDLIRRASRDTAWAASVRDSGHRRAMAEHTYRHRLTRILADATGRLTGGL